MLKRHVYVYNVLKVYVFSIIISTIEGTFMLSFKTLRVRLGEKKKDAKRCRKYKGKTKTSREFKSSNHASVSVRNSK